MQWFSRKEKNNKSDPATTTSPVKQAIDISPLYIDGLLAPLVVAEINGDLQQLAVNLNHALLITVGTHAGTRTYRLSPEDDAIGLRTANQHFREMFEPHYDGMIEVGAEPPHRHPHLPFIQPVKPTPAPLPVAGSIANWTDHGFNHAYNKPAMNCMDDNTVLAPLREKIEIVIGKQQPTRHPH